MGVRCAYGASILLLLRDGDGALPEAVPELPPDDGEVAHAPGAGGLATTGLHRPKT